MTKIIMGLTLLVSFSAFANGTKAFVMDSKDSSTLYVNADSEIECTTKKLELLQKINAANVIVLSETNCKAQGDTFTAGITVFKY